MKHRSLAATSVVLAFEELGLEGVSEYVAWAVDLVSRGVENGSILALAALHGDPRCGYFEIQGWLRKVIHSLSLAPITGKVAVELFVLGTVKCLPASPELHSRRPENQIHFSAARSRCPHCS